MATFLFIYKKLEGTLRGWNDVLYKASKNAFSAKLRNKLRHLRTIKSILNAQQKGAAFSKFLMYIYFRAAKMNINQEDLVGPFLKVSS